MHKMILIGLSLLAFSPPILAISNANTRAPQPASCIEGVFSHTGSKYWKTMNLVITNKCGQPVDFQDSSFTFINNKQINTSFWGAFGPLSYPDNTLTISSTPDSAKGKYRASFNLHFPVYSGSNSVLPAGKSFTINYGAERADYVQGSLSAFVGQPVDSGIIALTNTSPQPGNIAQPYALVHITLNGNHVTDTQLPWAGNINIPNLAVGTYALSPASVTDSQGNVYEGTANPATVSVTANTTAASSISYTLTQIAGSISFHVAALPSELNGYSSNPTVLLTNTQTSGSTNASLTWNGTTTIGKLKGGVIYSFSSPTITYNGYNCSSNFVPSSATASSQTIPIVSIAYACTAIPQVDVPVNVSGLDANTNQVDVTFTPSNNMMPITKQVALVNGQGSATVKLTDGSVYNVASTTVNGYSATFSPQPLIAKSNVTESIVYSQQTESAGRIIGYVPGWKTPPTASELAAAGYTHVMISFGVFSTSMPGEIYPAFDTVSPSYIQSLHDVGIKAILSIGGALTSIPNTTVNFHDALTLAGSSSVFKERFLQSLETLSSQYGFDGVDIDIEHGINAGGTFSNPQGDIAVLADILNTLHARNPSYLITMAPQTANVSATSGFSSIWGNYASLIMQTHDAITWVGIQLYNTGCMFGIDQVCYDVNKTNSPDFSVALATDVLENWPTALGFQPYISYLRPDQVVLGYLSPDASGRVDGGPNTPVSTVKRAIQCLRTGVKSATSCDSYVPPRTYPDIGGVFNWEVTFDKSNNFDFAKSLVNCVKNRNCQ